MKILLSAALCAACVHGGTICASEAGSNYAQAVHLARQQNYDAAFMHLRALLNEPAGTRYHQEALFATAEYYYLNAIYAEALRSCREYLTHYPDSPNRVFILAYVLLIAEFQGQHDLVALLVHQIITMQQVSLVFRESKEYTYTSNLQRTLKVVYYIDKVEFYADEQLFKSIPY